jgi:hypothetical protein
MCRMLGLSRLPFENRLQETQPDANGDGFEQLDRDRVGVLDKPSLEDFRSHGALSNVTSHALYVLEQS